MARRGVVRIPLLLKLVLPSVRIASLGGEFLKRREMGNYECEVAVDLSLPPTSGYGNLYWYCVAHRVTSFAIFIIK